MQAGLLKSRPVPRRPRIPVQQNCYMWHYIHSMMSLHMIGVQDLAYSISVPDYPQSCPKEELQGKMQPKQEEPWPLDESVMGAAQTFWHPCCISMLDNTGTALALKKVISYDSMCLCTSNSPWGLQATYNHTSLLMALLQVFNYV